MQVVLDEKDDLAAANGTLLRFVAALPRARDSLLDQLRRSNDAQAIRRIDCRHNHLGHILLLAIEAKMTSLLSSALLVDQVSEGAGLTAAEVALQQSPKLLVNFSDRGWVLRERWHHVEVQIRNPYCWHTFNLVEAHCLGGAIELVDRLLAFLLLRKPRNFDLHRRAKG